ncbi:MAG: type II toxin-antitoxin system VapC family toxin [Hyphomicrobium sp.]|nr:type II toxin-antitoxin system VapC family toxin [Hyphomicrobium sp.]
MIVIDRTSFMALVDKVADSAIQRAIDDGDVPSIYMAYETGLKAGLTNIGLHKIGGPAHLLQRIEETELMVLPRATVHSASARAMFEQFGVGHHPTSRLTLGDCAAFTRALALSADLVCEASEFQAMTVIYRLCHEWYFKQDRRPPRDFKPIQTIMHMFTPYEGESEFAWESRLKKLDDELAAELDRTRRAVSRDARTCCSQVPMDRRPKVRKHLSLTYHIDPDHGWLEVERNHIADLGICHRVSTDSRVGDYIAFLDKDYDMPAFLEAAERFGWTVSLTERHYDTRCNIRNVPRYQPPRDSWSPTQETPRTTRRR